MYGFSTTRARRGLGSAEKLSGLTLASLIVLTTACSESLTPTDPVMTATPTTAALGKGNGGGGGGGSAGPKIVFINGGATIRRILTVNPDGSSLDTLGGTGEFNTPVWSPDHSLIAYTVGDGGYPPIYTMRANGSQVRQIGNGLEPRWSPNGSKVAYHRWASFNGGPTQSDIYVMNANGTNILRLTVDTAFDGHATWSPDGNRIAFHSRRSGNDEIWVMNADGTGQAKITACINLLASCSSPTWSPAPGDERIMYTFYVPGQTAIRTITANGSAGSTLLPGLGATGAAWSQDATRLVFSYVAPGLVQKNIYTAKLDGSDLRRLTFDTQRSDIVPNWVR